MHPARNPRRHAHGVTYIEVLVASLVLMVSLAGMVSMWYVSFHVSASTAEEGIAYNIARREIEQIKETGFDNTALGTTTTYYDGVGTASAAQTSGSVLQCATTVSADKTATTSDGSTLPASDAIVTVSVTVRLVSDGQMVYQTATYLVRSGV